MIIGLYRKNNQIVAIESDQHSFFDSQLKTTYQSVIVPLTLFKSGSKWMLTNDADDIADPLKDILDSQLTFITASTEKTIFYALMITEQQNPSMSRVGYLLIKEQGQFVPVTVSIDGKPYLVEMKGCGSPLGGLTEVHHRNQAGCQQKCHLRLTGGLPLAECQDEFQNLENNRQLYENSNYSYDVRSLGYTTFSISVREQVQSYALLIRLVPSTLRASYCSHPDIDTLLKNKDEAFYQMGLETRYHLISNSPALHHNMNLNNMVYVSEKQFALTDWGEASNLVDGHCAIDRALTIYPREFLQQTMRSLDFNCFFKGLKLTSKGGVSSKLKDQYLYVKQSQSQLAEMLGAAFFNYRKQNGVAFNHLDE